MEREYIQLSPLPADMEWDAVKVIWEYEKLPAEEKKRVYEDIFRLSGKKEEETPDIPEECPEAEREKIADYVEALKELMASLMTEASDIAAWVFARKYINGRTLDEMLEELSHTEKFICAIDIMFEQTATVEEDEEEEN